jgi:hypothetical protein
MQSITEATADVLGRAIVAKHPKLGLEYLHRFGIQPSDTWTLFMAWVEWEHPEALREESDADED